MPTTSSSKTREHNVTLTLVPTCLLGHLYDPPGSAESISAATWIQPLTLVTDQISSGPEGSPGPTEHPPSTDCPSLTGQAGRPRLQLSHAEPTQEMLRHDEGSNGTALLAATFLLPRSSHHDTASAPSANTCPPQVTCPGFLQPVVPSVLPYLPSGVLPLPTLHGRS